MPDRAHLFRGEWLSAAELEGALKELPAILEQDLVEGPPPLDRVLEAIGGLHRGTDWQAMERAFSAAGAGGYAGELTRAARQALHPDVLWEKLRMELGQDPFQPTEVQQNVWECYAPLGVLLHIAAGNTPGLGALSALEGLLAGNINLIKLPQGEGGLTADLLRRLCEEQPALKPYLYALDISSGETERIKGLLALADGIAVWGSDEAVASLRMLAPPSVPLIEWGHRLSFAYVRPDAVNDAALEALARDVCEAEQRLCTAPQCILLDENRLESLNEFAQRFAKAMQAVSPQYPKAPMDLHQMADVTLAVQTARALEAVERRRVFSASDGSWHLWVDGEAKQPQASPLNRVVPILGIPEGELMTALRPHHGHLQTVGLIAEEPHRARLAQLLLRAGATRIARAGQMSKGTLADPRDGQAPLGRYVRRVRVQS